MAEPVPLLFLEGGIDPARRIEAEELARQVNAVIYEMTARLNELVRSEEPVGFLCECGCLAIASVTVDEYDASGGAWLPEHKPSDQAGAS
jgi:hypothetical protein